MEQKFQATLIFYFLAVLPWGLYLISLHRRRPAVQYRPIITFFIALMATGAGLLSMGCSFPASHAIGSSALLTAAGVISWTMTFMLKGTIAAASGTRPETLAETGLVRRFVVYLDRRKVARVADLPHLAHDLLAVPDDQSAGARKWA